MMMIQLWLMNMIGYWIWILDTGYDDGVGGGDDDDGDDDNDDQ